MIISGYQGIGKSTLAKTRMDVIDLESSCFWKEENGEKKRPEEWWVYYCQMAQHLSSQGYTVFVSCHPEVRQLLSKNSKERFYCLYPSLDLKNEWLEKLEQRYILSKSDKDKRAYEHAKNSYDKDIETLSNEFSDKDGFRITGSSYDLGQIVDFLSLM